MCKNAISSDPPCRDYNARFTTVQLKSLSDQSIRCSILCNFENWLFLIVVSWNYAYVVPLMKYILRLLSSMGLQVIYSCLFVKLSSYVQTRFVVQCKLYNVNLHCTLYNLHVWNEMYNTYKHPILYKWFIEEFDIRV